MRIIRRAVKNAIKRLLLYRLRQLDAIKGSFNLFFQLMISHDSASFNIFFPRAIQE